jgi:glutaredoxin-like YruB-family protein
MKTITVNSFAELQKGVAGSPRSFLLIYKAGSEQSDCALDRLNQLELPDEPVIFSADVSKVTDIHENFGVTTAPTLIAFNGGKAVNVIKGCQTEAAYRSIVTGKEFGLGSEVDKKKAKQVIVYTTPTCSWCTTLKTYLNENRVAYREINVASDTSAAEAMVRKSGQQGVPQTEINGQMIVGFDKNRINQLLEIH